MRFWWTTMGYAQLHRRTITRFFWLETIKGRLTAVNMTTATAQTFVQRRNAVNCRQRQVSSRELNAEDVVSTRLSLSDAKRSEALTKNCHESFKNIVHDNLPAVTEIKREAAKIIVDFAFGNEFERAQYVIAWRWHMYDIINSILRRKRHKYVTNQRNVKNLAESASTWSVAALRNW